MELKSREPPTGHPITMNTLSYAINFWSKGRIKALFLRHEGYLGAMGAFLRHVNAPHRNRIGSFTENFSQIQKISGTSLGAVGALDEFPSSLTAFPLLEDPHTYDPDTIQLTEPELQHYWIDLLDKNLGDLVEMVMDWKRDQRDTKSRASSFEAMYREHLQRLRTEPLAYGALSIRSLLNLREQCLREMGFTDIFEGVKQKENTSAMEGLATLLTKLDALDEKERIDVLIDNVLAGEVNWGPIRIEICMIGGEYVQRPKVTSPQLTPSYRSTSVMEMLKKGQLDFLTAKATVGRPPKFDTSASFKERLLSGPAYEKAVVFVDNSGSDIVLGIIPFARYLLSKGTKVILAANTSPSVNDITATELAALIEKITYFDGLIRRSRENGALQVVGTGSASPCLDLLHISAELAKACEDVDLVVVEGMGRAIHTNFHAKFRVDSLKIAVFKNPQVAKALGAVMYDALCIFDSPKGQKEVGYTSF
ncbi:hypothetical protein HDV00_001073 [Rhizophlyctis rosea]|nr:hypothetical protein HDV00_001073 [Rhizophlyctis rosea]